MIYYGELSVKANVNRDNSVRIEFFSKKARRRVFPEDTEFDIKQTTMAYTFTNIEDAIAALLCMYKTMTMKSYRKTVYKDDYCWVLKDSTNVRFSVGPFDIIIGHVEDRSRIQLFVYEDSMEPVDWGFVEFSDLGHVNIETKFMQALTDIGVPKERVKEMAALYEVIE